MEIHPIGITGPPTSTNNAIVRWDGSSGSVIQNSGIIVDDSDNMSGIGNITGTDLDIFAGTGTFITTGTISGNILFATAHLSLFDSGTDGSTFLQIEALDNAYSANRTLSIDLGNADRTLTFSNSVLGVVTVSNWFDQSVKTTASPTFVTVNATTLDLGTNDISDGNFNGDWAFNSGNLSGIGTIGSGAITSTGTIKGLKFHTTNAVEPAANDGAALGNGADASGAGAFAAGPSSIASGTSSNALGREVQATDLNTTAVGGFVGATATNSLIVAIAEAFSTALASGSPSVVVGIERSGKGKTNNLSATAQSTVALGMDVSATAANTCISGIGFTNNATETYQLGYECEGLRFALTETVFNDGGLDLDFRIESTGEDKLFLIDAGLDVVRMGDGDTNYIETNAAGDTFWVGSGTGLPYGHMYVDGTQVIRVALTLNTPAEVEGDGTGGTAVAEDGWLSGDLNLITFPTGGTEHYITITKAGVYHITWNLSFTMVTGAANTQIHAGLAIDSTTFRRDRCEAHRTISNNTDTGNMSGSCMIDLPNGNEELSLWMENTTNSNDADVNHGSLTAVMVGGT